MAETKFPTEMVSLPSKGLLYSKDKKPTSHWFLNNYVIDQLIHLVVFCKAINIPFDVYAFTTGNRLERKKMEDLYRDGDLN